MVRFINTRESGDGANGKSFRVGETTFVVAGPSVPRTENRPPGLSMTSLTFSIPPSDTDLDEQPGDYAVDDESESAQAHVDDGDQDFDDAAPVTGTELLAPPAPATSETSIERRLADIVPVPPATHAGLGPPLPDGMYLKGHRLPPPSPARFIIPAVVILLLAGSIGLMIHFQRQTQRDLESLRAGIRDDQQDAGNVMISEVRRELRALPLPDPKAVLDQGERNAQAILELKQTIADRTRKTDGQTEQLSQVIREGLAGQKPADVNLDEVKEPILAEIREMKDALAELRSRPAYVPAPAEPAKTVTDAAGVAAAPVSSAPADAGPDASATLAKAQMSVAARPAERPSTVYLVDATGHLRDLVPEALAEVRRLIQHQDASTPPYVLLLYSERLVRVAGLPQSSDSAAPPVVDLGHADIFGALKIALESRPRTLHILSDTLGGGGSAKVAEALHRMNREGTQVDATQFHYREGQEIMKRIAREHNGMYAYIPASR